MQQSTLPPRSEVNGDSPATSIAPVFRRLPDLRLFLICVAFLAIGVLGLNERMMYSPDSARYLLWAKSLAAFEGFANASGPETLRYVVHAPFYPLMLTPLAWLFVDIVIPAKLLTLLCGVGLLVLFFRWTASWAGKGASLIGTLFLALNSLTILFSDHVLSDIPFIAFVVVFFMLAEKMYEHPAEDRWAWWLVAILTAGIFLREIGLTLLIGALAYLLLTKQYRRLLLVFVIPMLFYLLWYFRNEVYYAGLENPSIRNMRLFMGHYFTADSDSLLREFLGRIEANAAVYLRWGRGLVLFPQFLSQSFAVVSISTPLMEAMNRVLQIAQYPLILLQYGLFGWGVYSGWRKNKTTPLILLFIFFYMCVVLLYPINDMRFLVPMMVIMLHFCVLGGRDLADRLSGRIQRKRIALALVAITLFLMAIPNAVWAYGYVEGNKGYLRDRNDPTRQVGQWIAQHSDPSTTVLSRWGEIGLWLDGRKLLLTDNLLTLRAFDSYLRDYSIEYVVTFVSEPGIRDFEFQMLQSRKYSFTPVYRVGRYEIVQVRKLSDIRSVEVPTISAGPGEGQSVVPPVEVDVRNFFARGVRELETGKPSEALHIFSTLLESSHSGYIGLFCGISLEIGGQYKSALRLYDQLRNQLQAGPFIVHSRYHVMLVKNLEQAEKEKLPAGKAGILQGVSSAYWDLGLRRFAVQLLEKSLREDSTFAPSLIFGMYYSLQQGDTAGAKRYFARLKSNNPKHTIISTVQNILETLDSARAAATIPQRLLWQLRVAKGYAQLGLMDAAIDESYSILDRDSVNVGALQVLADAYDVQRVAPAIRVLERLVKVKPDDSVASERLERLKKRN